MTGLLHDHLIAWARDAPGDLAVVDGDGQWTVADLLIRVRGLAAGIVRRVGAGERMALIADNCLDALALLYAAPMADRPLLLVNTRLHPDEQARLVEDVGAALVLDLTTDAGRSALVDLRDGPGISEVPAGARPDDLAWIIHTSGTTGAPKGVRLTHRSLLSAVEVTAAARPFADDDVYLYPFPLFHVAAYNVVHAHWRRRPVVLVARFDVDAFCRAAEQHRVTTASLAPTMIAMLLDAPARREHDLSSLRTIAYGASAIPLDVLVRGMAELGCDFAQGYGMTELSGNAVFLDAEMHRRARTERPEWLAAAGRPGPGVEIRLIDPHGDEVPTGRSGEILIRAPQVCDGYWDQPTVSATTIVDGWLHTGDVGRLDDDGVLYVVDRLKDLIVTGGENVASREVEDLVARHPDVGSVAVVGVPDERWGEKVVAVVTSAPGAVADADVIERWCAERISRFKRPKSVLVVGSLPTSASGKVLKRDVRAAAIRLLATSDGGTGGLTENPSRRPSDDACGGAL